MGILWIDEYLIEKRFEAYRNFLRDKRYSSSELGAIYRVINHWAEMDLIDGERTSSDKWRRFNIIDLVWVQIIHECRKYGMGLDKLLNLRKWLFDYGSKEIPSYELEFRVFLTMAKTSINLLVFEDGYGLFISESSRFSEEYIKQDIMVRLGKRSAIVIDINQMVATVFSGKDMSPIFQHTSVLANEEQELITFLRFNEFDEVRVVLKNGKVERMEGKKTKELETSLVELMKQHDYQRIEVLVQDKQKTKVIQTVLKKPNEHGTSPAQK